MNLTELKQPFHPSQVKWRVGSTNKDKTQGMALAYADARAFMDKLDDAVGPQNWQDEYFDSPSGRVFCKVGIKIGDEWVWKADGAGVTQVEGEKGAISDAFKRACVKWGMGRYLYDLKSPWVQLKQQGRSYVIDQSAYGQLNALLGQPHPKPAKKKIAPVIQPKEVALSARDDYEQHISPGTATKRDAPTVKAALMELSDGKDGNPSEGQLKYARASLSKLVDANAADAKSIIYFLFGKESSSDLTSGEASALIDWAGSNKDNNWTPDSKAITEAAAIVTAQNVASGQQPLFDNEPELRTDGGAYGSV